MSATTRSPVSADWRDLASLGEHLASTTSFVEQRNRIIAMTSRLLDGNADVWLHENLFRLPNMGEESLFPARPLSAGMKRVLKLGKLCTKQKRETKDHASHGTWAAIPLEDQGMTLGALQITRLKGPEFKSDELDLLKGLAGVIAVSLIASHRLAVERFRLNQLNLVREVSAQIANTLSVTELASRVTELIQQTFHYYYVAIFTTPPASLKSLSVASGAVHDRSASASMRFRSSAMAPRKDRRKAKVALDVEIGQRLIARAAAEGKRVLVADVQKDPRYRFIGGLPETHSEGVIRLKMEERVLGVLDVQSDLV